MLVRIYEPWLRHFHWNILLLLSVFTQDVFAASVSSEISGIIAAGIISLFLIISIIIAVVYFCNSLKEKQKQHVYQTRSMDELRRSVYQMKSVDGFKQSAVSSVPKIVTTNHYVETPNRIYDHAMVNAGSNFLQPLPHHNMDYQRSYSSSLGTHYDAFRKSQNQAGISNYSVVSNMKPITLETVASVHGRYNNSVKQADIMELNASRAEPQFILKQREEILPDASKYYSSDKEEMSALDFMIRSKNQQSFERSDLRYTINDNNNSNSLKNNGMFFTVADYSQDRAPSPEYEDGTENKIVHQGMFKGGEVNRTGYNVDLNEIKKNISPLKVDRSFKGGWYESYSKQVQFNSNPENIAISNVSLRS